MNRDVARRLRMFPMSLLLARGWTCTETPLGFIVRGPRPHHTFRLVRRARAFWLVPTFDLTQVLA